MVREGPYLHKHQLCVSEGDLDEPRLSLYLGPLSVNRASHNIQRF